MQFLFASNTVHLWLVGSVDIEEGLFVCCVRMFGTHWDRQWVTVEGALYKRRNLTMFIFTNDGRDRYWTWKEQVKKGGWLRVLPLT